MAFLKSLFGRSAPRNDLHALYAAIIAEGRQPHWYRDGRVPDTLDGRFDMIAAVLSLVLLRMETLEASDETAHLAEVFVDDMEGQLRQMGVGDVVVGKHVGRMMSALGGRLGAYRSALAGEGSLDEALERNLYRGSAPDAGAVAHTAAAVRSLAAQLDARDIATLRAGDIGGTGDIGSSAP
ncbi:ubiquinol-cytochrome C chaperone [Sphingobium sufflavum]|uniref:ubiquinol-cytochrome C chaperone family protein n=1 Tax=Sphingobium sufflavum TaxID=1129547 RepID=UPI001F3960EB|nr:ubiquinol-cytochrome C chaperone family protein [Sphingobium sufflavum]MCE7795144.1 ubiquinol-cytochrome C chaperone [Sphingobium sufflavum]